MSDRNKAFELQERLQENGISDTCLLEFLVNNYLTGADALQAMQAALVEFGLEEEEDEEDELEVGMEVEIVDGSNSVNYEGDTGFITEYDQSDDTFRVVVEGRMKSGNWMRRSQIARINY